MSDKKFDQLLSEIRNSKVDDGVVDQAAERVWGSITASPECRVEHAQAAEL